VIGLALTFKPHDSESMKRNFIVFWKALEISYKNM